MKYQQDWDENTRNYANWLNCHNQRLLQIGIESYRDEGKGFLIVYYRKGNPQLGYVNLDTVNLKDLQQYYLIVPDFEKALYSYDPQKQAVVLGVIGKYLLPTTLNLGFYGWLN